MKIDPDKCVACGNCTYVCPVGAIYIDPVKRRATVNSNECVECYACYNGLSQEHLNPTFRPHAAQSFSNTAPTFRPRARRLSDRCVCAR